MTFNLEKFAKLEKFALGLVPVALVSMSAAALAQTAAAPAAVPAKPMAADHAMPAGKAMSADKPMAAGTAGADKMPTAATMSDAQVVKASDIIGMDVHGANDKKIGDVKDLIVDMDNGDVRYAVVEFDADAMKSDAKGGDKLYSVPVKDLGRMTDKKYLTYDMGMNSAALQHVSMNKADWKKALLNRQYLEGTDKAYGMKGMEGKGTRTYAASDLIGMDVKSREGKNIGDIKELVLNMKDGKIPFAVLAFDPGFFTSEKVFAFTLASFTAGKDRKDLVLNVDKSKIQAMKDFKPDQWKNMNAPDRSGYVNSVSN